MSKKLLVLMALVLFAAMLATAAAGFAKDGRDNTAASQAASSVQLTSLAILKLKLKLKLRRPPPPRFQVPARLR